MRPLYHLRNHPRLHRCMQRQGALGRSGQHRLIVLVEVQHAVETDRADHTSEAAFTGDFFQTAATQDTDRDDAVD